ncbi:hypothetical protein CEQ90_07760 [Lewinellaceae bacterium SD302]|nr:hypothetical protein CEQ90_07760 [Lewinellaceae bacterium SD302]
MNLNKFCERIFLLHYLVTSINPICIMRSFTLLMLTILLATSGLSAKLIEGQAADDLISGASVLRYADGQKYPQYIRLQPGHEQSFEYGAEWIIRQFGLPAGTTLEVLADDTDRNGMRHLRLQQHLDGKIVLASQIILHGRGDHWTHATGDLYPVNVQTASPVLLTSSQAIATALDILPAKDYGWEVTPALSDYPTADLIWVPTNLDFEGQAFQLTYAVKVYSVDPLSHKTVYLDVATGNEIARVEHIHTRDGNGDKHNCADGHHHEPATTVIPGTAETRYSGIRTLETEEDEDLKFILRDYTRGDGVETYNSQTQDAYLYIDFADPDNYWDNVNADQDEVATDVHWGTQAYYDLLQTLGRNSIDGDGELLESHLHYGNNFQNAFWDGNRMTYGDGNPGGFLISPLVTSEVVAHELTHGLTERTAGLIYNDESGALNESFSDIFGASMNFIENPMDGSWTIGGPLTADGLGIRSMSDPNVHNNPDTYDGDFWTDGAGVHTNSGVQNHWFQLLVDGETGVNELGYAYDLAPMALDSALEIAFNNLAFYLTPSSNYQDAGFNSTLAAADLHGTCSSYTIRVWEAWQAVGVIFGSPAVLTANFTLESTVFCDPDEAIQFNNVSFANEYLWDFGDGNTSTEEDPVHIYGDVGSYTVTLTSFGGECSNDTVVNVVENAVIIDPEDILCTASFLTESQTVESCSGALFDSGGPNGNYQDLEDYTFTIISTEGTAVILDIVELNIEATYDFIYIYDGNNANAPLIATLTGSDQNLTYESTGGAITIRFDSDFTVTDGGFLIEWSCAELTAPVVNIGADDQSVCDGVVNFNDLSGSLPTSWEWNFGDGNSSTEQNPTHTYTESGIYNVSLTACNELGCNTQVFENFVEVDFTGVLCQTIVFEEGNIVEVDFCTGFLQSPNFPSEYPDNFQGAVLLTSPSGNPYTLTVVQFDVEAGFDFLSIYDGENLGAPLIGTYSNPDLSPGDVITSTSGSLYVVFLTDGSVTEGGFELAYDCGVGSIDQVSIGATQEQGCPGTYVFEALQGAANFQYDWDFGDGTTAEGPGPHAHTYAATGAYTATLLVQDDGNNADLETTVNVNSLSLPLAIDGPILVEQGSQVEYTYDGTDLLNEFSWSIDGAAVATGEILDYTWNDLGLYELRLDANSTEVCAAAATIEVEVVEVINVRDNDAAAISSLTLFPNPATNRLNVSLMTNEVMEVTYVITDLLGRDLRNVRAGSQAAGNFQLDLAGLPSATYILKAISTEDGRQLAVRRFVKQ